MKNNSTSLSQAFKLYTGTNVVKFTLKLVIYDIIFILFFSLVCGSVDEKMVMHCYFSIISFLSSGLTIFRTYNSKISGAVFRTVKDSIRMYQKYHLTSTLSGITIIVLTNLFLAVFFSSVTAAISICLFTLFIRALANIFCIIKRDVVRTTVLLITVLPAMIGLLIFASLIEDEHIKLELGTIHIILAVSATVIFVVSEIIVLKQFRKNWYKD